jgi:pimeloyl-ACP methyl ester carboxylesterase
MGASSDTGGGDEMPEVTLSNQARLSFDRYGEGEPLLLIHGTGGSRADWQPIAERVSAAREVLAVDLPGHGRSSIPPPELPPTPAGYARALGELLDALGLGTAHAAGVSVGGWTALELAKLGRARSVVALGPAGLWRKRDPRAAVFKLSQQHRMGRRFRRLMPALLETRIGRTLVLGGDFGRPWLIPPETAVELVQTFAQTPGFDAHLAATSRERFSGGRAIEVPVTVAFGQRDRLLKRRKARFRDELPEQTRWLELPGCGHVPMWDDPSLVAETILTGTSTAAATASEA